MNFKSFALILCFTPVLCGAENAVINQSFIPDKTNRAYTVMVEAGAKLLEFDIIRARVNAQEKALVADLQKEQYTSTAGKALGVLGPLEQLAHGFDDVIPAFLILQNAITDAATAKTAKTQISQALNGLVALLAQPEVLHAVLPQPELVGASYRDAMTYAPTATFVKTVQAIAHKKFMLHYCTEDQQLVGQQALPNDAHLFYGVIRQTVQNLFGEMIKTTPVAPVVAVLVVEPKVNLDVVSEKTLQMFWKLKNHDQDLRSGECNKSLWIEIIDLGRGDTTPQVNSETPVDVSHLLQLLLQKGADVNQRIFSGTMQYTPLTYAINSLNVPAVKFLLKNGAQVNQPGMLLPARGVNVWAENCSPLSYAMLQCKQYNVFPQWGRLATEIIEIIKQYGGKTTEECCQ